MSVSCALWATSLHQWARRYLRLTQPPRCNPEKRARARAFFAGGADKMHIPWAVEGLPMLLHLSLFLFFGGLVIFLFNVNHEVFRYVICWIGIFSVVYGLITLLPLIRHDSPYNSPLSTLAWFLYAGIPHLASTILCIITCCGSRTFWPFRTWEYSAEKTASKRSSKIDAEILDWTFSTLGDDDSLMSFFEAIPDFFKSKLVENPQKHFSWELILKFKYVLGGFLARTWSSDSIDDEEKVRRLGISFNVIDQIRDAFHRSILYDILYHLRRQVPQTVEMGHTLARWFANNDQDIPDVAQRLIRGILVHVRERNDNWVTLAAQVFGLSERYLRDNIALGDDSVLLAIFIHFTRRSPRSFYYDWFASQEVSELDIRNTHPRLQNDFCTLWNEIVQEARNQGISTSVKILRTFRHHYIDLHQGTDAAPTVFSASTNDFDSNLYYPSSYPFCTLASHRLDSTPLPLPTQPANLPDALSLSPTDGANTASRQVEQANNVLEPPSSSNSTTTSEFEVTSHGPDITPPANPVHSTSRPTGESSTAVVAAAPQDKDITSTATLSHLLEGSEQQDPHMVSSSAEPETSQILSTTSTPAPAPTLARTPTSLPNTPSEPYDADVTSVSNSLHFAPPSIVSSIPASRSTDGATFPRLRPRGLVNTRNICFANAVLQLLVNSPPFWNLFRELGNLEGQRGAGVPETGGSSMPLVDAMVRFFKEFIVEEESPSTQQQSQPATGGTSRVDEEKKDNNVIDSFEPTYLYDMMKEKRQLKPLLVCSRAHIATSCY